MHNMHNSYFEKVTKIFVSLLFSKMITFEIFTHVAEPKHLIFFKIKSF